MKLIRGSLFCLVLFMVFAAPGFSGSRSAPLGLTASPSVCRSSLVPVRVDLPSSVNLSDDLLIEIRLSGNELPKTVMINDASLYGMVSGKGGFFRPIDPFVANLIRSDGVYQARVSLASWATRKNLWPLIEKAQREWNVGSVGTDLSMSVVDSQGCNTPTVSAKTEIKIAGFTRNNAISGTPPQILSVESPKEIRFGETFVVRGSVEDKDNDLPSETVPILGSMSVTGVPFSLRLPPTIKAIRGSSGVYEATIGPEEFGFYNEILKMWPGKKIDLTIHFFIEDNVGHRSNSEKIQLAVIKS